MKWGWGWGDQDFGVCMHIPVYARTVSFLGWYVGVKGTNTQYSGVKKILLRIFFKVLNNNCLVVDIHKNWEWENILGVPKKMRLCFCLISRQPSIRLANNFFSWKLRSIRTFSIQNHFCAIKGAENFIKQNGVLEQIN